MPLEKDAPRVTAEDLHLALVWQLAAGLDRFPDGRIDYTTAVACPVVNCIVVHGAEMLLVQRSERVSDAGRWSGVTGYVDKCCTINTSRLCPINEVVMTELREELGLSGDDVAHIAVADPQLSVEPEVGKVFVTFAVLVVVTSRAVRLNWENSGHVWIDPGQAGHYPLLSGQERIIRRALALGQTNHVSRPGGRPEG